MLAVTAVAMLGSGALCGRWSVVLPTVVGGGSHAVLVTTFLPLTWAAAISDGFASRLQAVEARPVGRGRWRVSRLAILDAVLFLGSSAAVAALFAALVRVAGSPLVGMGPVLVLSGVSASATVRAGPAVGASASSALVILTTVYGVTAPAGPYLRVLQHDGNAAWSLVCGVSLCLISSFLLVTGRTGDRR